MSLISSITSAAGQKLSAIPPAIKSYKPSRFNAHTRLPNGTTVLFNTGTGKHCAIPALSRDNLAGYLSRVPRPGPLDPLGEYLRAQGYIVEAEVDEFERFKVQHGLGHFRTDLFQLMLLASEDCNFRCVYCSQQFKRGVMQPWVREAVKRIFDAKISTVNSFSVDWFGGEPMLGYEVMEELLPYFNQRCAEERVRFSSTMTTNGFLLTPERSRKLVQWGVVRYQITIDGSAIEHDKHRPLKEGGSTFYTILSNLRAMRDLKEDFRVVLRMNYDQDNAGALGSAFETLAESFAGDKRFVVRFRPVGQWGGPNDAALNVCGNQERSTLVKLDTAARQTGLSTEPFADDLQPNNVCYAARPYHMIVGADGKLMKCSVVLDTMPENIIGQISEDGAIEINESRLIEWIKPFYTADTTCQKCFFLPSCQGASCPLSRFGGYRPCPTAKAEIQQTLRDVYAQQAAAQNATSSLINQEALVGVS